VHTRLCDIDACVCTFVCVHVNMCVTDPRVCVTGTWTQGLACARQAFYPLSYEPSPLVFILFLRRSLATLAQAGLELAIFLPLPPE
jgi:hypothetical protein